MRMMTGLGVLAGLACIAGPAVATTSVHSTFGVQLVVTAECVINSATLLDFATKGVINSNIDSTSSLKIQCTDTTAYSVALDKGTSAGGTISQRKLINAGATINYNLYTDSPGGTLWGDGTTGVPVSATGNGDEQTITVYGRIPPQTTAAPGTYTDTVTFIVTY
jgi:spore coat protein U-like protein